MKKYLLLLFVLGICQVFAAKDMRPAFDKSGYKGTLWTQVNPWFPVNKARTLNPLGGPNYAAKVYHGINDQYDKEAWKEAIKECQKYGMTGWQFELNASAPGFAYHLKNILQGAKEIDTGFKLAVFIGHFGGGDFETRKNRLIKQFDILSKEWKNHPNIYRLNGAPVISVYTPFAFKPEEWKNVMDEFEEKHGKCIWLFNFWHKTYDVESKPAQIRAYMPYFDGITAYGNWGLTAQTELFKVIGKIMREEFPQKIFEGCVQNAYACHYYHGGVSTRLSEKYRAAWDSMAAAEVDSVVMTNFFDHWENSLILPCYERGDFMLRYAEYQMHKIFGKKFNKSKRPELILINYIDTVPGSRKLEFEIIVLPIDSKHIDMEIGLEIGNAAGKIIKIFPTQKIALNKEYFLRYEIADEEVLGETFLIPRIYGRYIGRPYKSNFNPPTMLDPSIRTSMMFYARSTVSSVKADTDEWTLNGVAPGSKVDWNATNGMGFFQCNITPETPGVNAVRIMRNNRELYRIPQKNMIFGRAFPLPNPGLAMNFYHLEMETADGKRFQTRPIFVTSNQRSGKAEVKFLVNDKIINANVDKDTVPEFFYPCDVDSGQMLLDISGFEHHGKLNMNGKTGYCFGSFGHTDYYHVHDGNAGGNINPLFRRDKNGRGYLHFDSSQKHFYMISGGTAMPYSSTYEMDFMPILNGSKMFLLGSANNQINLYIDEKGYLCIMRGGAVEGEGGIIPKKRQNIVLQSKKPVVSGEWQTVKVVYDMHKLYLYLNNELQSSHDVLPLREHETIDHLTVASRCGFLHNPGNFFNGGIKNIRISGYAKK